VKVLAIDDDKEFLNLIEVHLKKVGYTTTAILDSDGILTAITQETYDLVLVDWMMPDVDGITVIKAIRTRDKQTGNKTKIIMVTAINNTMAKSYARRSGADGFLPKSENRDDFKTRLFETIRSVMNEAAVK
jgi:two-component system, OmpR family, response regulator VicR